MTEFKRRACVSQPGDPLLLPLTARASDHQPGDMATQTVRRHMTWIDAAVGPGASEDPANLARFLRLATVLVPLPIYTDSPGRQFAHVAPEMLWHPLFWLPSRCAGRYQLMSVDGEDLGPEDEDAWAVRVVLEMSVSGLYDAATGTWLDVLARAGIDVDDPVDVARIEAWQAGERDIVLDAIDLSPDLDMPDDPDWALGTAQALMDDLTPASWALTADDLAALTVEVGESTVAANEQGAVHQVVSTVVTFARALLGDVPWPIDVHETREFWDDLAQVLAAIDPQEVSVVLDEVAAPAAERLYSLREQYWEHLPTLGELVGQGQPGPEPEPELAA